MFKKTLFIAITSFLLLSCGSDSDSDLSNISFTSDILPAVSASGCTCHTGGGNSGTLRLDSYSSLIAPSNNNPLINRIDTGNPQSSFLINFPNTTTHTSQSSGVSYSSEEALRELLVVWISEGANNN